MAQPTYVGGNSGTWVGSTSSNNNVSLSALSGGSNSSPSQGDLVIAVYSTGSVADRALSIGDGTNAYALIDAELYANGSNTDTNFRIAYKFMGATPDANVVFGPTGNAQDAGSGIIHVWRGVDPSTALDVAAIPATGTGTGQPNAGSITPITTDAIILVAGGSAATSGAVFTASELSNFISATSADTNDSMTGMGSTPWTSGAFDPAQWAGGATGTGASWAAMTIALRPAPTVKTINAGSAALTIAGSTATISKQYTIAATAGALTIAAQNATITRQDTIAAGSAALVVAAQNATITQTRTIDATAGALTIAAQDAQILKGKTIMAGSAALTIAAQDASITKTWTIAATAGALVLAAQDAQVLQSKTIAAGSAALVVAAQDATIGKTDTITAGSAALTIAAQNATVSQVKTVNAGAAALVIAAQDATIETGSTRTINATSAALTIAAQPATINKWLTVAATSAALTIAAQDASITKSWRIQAGAGALAIAAHDATIETGLPEVPPGVTRSAGRTWRIPAEDRHWRIPAEDRNFVITKEQRRW